MDLLIAWGLFPLTLLVISAGLGLGLGRFCPSLPSLLVMPVGFCTGLAMVAPFYVLNGGAAAPSVVLATLALVGAWLGRARLRDLAAALAWGLVPAGLVFGLYAAPVVLSGQPGFLGYGLLGDTSIHFVLMDRLADVGVQTVSEPVSSFDAAVNGYLGGSYPVGPHGHLVSSAWLLGADRTEAYQPYLAVAVALAAMAIFALARSLRIGPRRAALVAFLALSMYLPYSYYLEGSIKEMVAICVLATLAALATGMVRAGQLDRGGVTAVGLVAGAGYLTFSYAILAWVVPLLAALAVWAWRSGGIPSPPWIKGPILAGLLVGALCVAALPELGRSSRFVETSRVTFTSEQELGNLIDPLPAIEAFGSWLEPDFRKSPPRYAVASFMGIALMALLALLGFAWSVRRRAVGPLALAAGMGTAYAVLVIRGSPWAEAKGLVLASVAIGLFAGLGIALLGALKLRRLFVLAALGGLAVVLASDGFAYHGAHLPTLPRLQEQAELARKFAGRGPTLWNEAEEFAKHYAREIDPVNPYEAWAPAPPLFREQPPLVFAHDFDLDRLQLTYVEQFPLIVIRRGPAASRPPVNYRRAFMGRYYEVWEKSRSPGPLDHISLGEDPQRGERVKCRRLKAFAAMARDRKALLALQPTQLNETVDLRSSIEGTPWRLAYEDDRLVRPVGEGTFQFDVFTSRGRYRMWTKGTFGRGVEIDIDGRPGGRTGERQSRYQYELVRVQGLDAGRHQLTLSRLEGGLAPGNGYPDLVGPTVLEPVRTYKPKLISPGSVEEWCGRTLDWIEIVR